MATSFRHIKTKKKRATGRPNHLANSLPFFKKPPQNSFSQHNLNTPAADQLTKMTDKELLYGINPVKLALSAQKRVLEKLLLSDDVTRPDDIQKINEIKNLAVTHQIPILNIKKKILGQMLQDDNHQGVALVAGYLPTYDFNSLISNKKISKLVALDHVQGPQNMGAIIRSACYFGFEGMLITNHNSAPLNSAVSRAAAGLLEIFNIYKATNLARALAEFKKNDFWVISADLDGENIYNFKPPNKFILLLGNEKNGIRPLVKKHSDFILTIPGKLLAESLNVSVAAGILMSNLTSQKN